MMTGQSSRKIHPTAARSVPVRTPKSVVVRYLGANDHLFVRKIERLRHCGYLVKIRLVPAMKDQAMGVPRDEFPFGIPAEDAYYQIDGDWYPTQTLERSVQHFYVDDEGITVRIVREPSL
jgi:hypothetical protein